MFFNIQGSLRKSVSYSGNQCRHGNQSNSRANASGVCNLGDPDGTGTFTLFVNPGQKRVCYELTIAGIDAPTAAHIHKAPPGIAGPIVIPFPTPPLGSSTGCADTTSRQAAQIIAKSGQYYFNVHNATYPGGALRGQLARAPH
jgi:hypothetical protein